MPYIKNEKRLDRQAAIEGLAQWLILPWDLNHAVCALVNEVLKRRGVSYKLLGQIMGDLDCAQREIYRRVAAPYEDWKMFANGDVFSEEVLSDGGNHSCADRDHAVSDNGTVAVEAVSTSFDWPWVHTWTPKALLTPRHPEV